MITYNLPLPDIPETYHFLSAVTEDIQLLEAISNSYETNINLMNEFTHLSHNKDFIFSNVDRKYSFYVEQQHFMGLLYAGLSIYPQLWNDESYITYQAVLKAVNSNCKGTTHLQKFMSGFIEGLSIFIPTFDSSIKRNYIISATKIEIMLNPIEEKSLYLLSRHEKKKNYKFFYYGKLK